MNSLMPIESRKLPGALCSTGRLNLKGEAIPSDITQIGTIVEHILDQAPLPLGHEDKESLGLALREVITNAIEHGNLEITQKEKSLALAQGRLGTLMEERLSHKRMAKRMVWVKAEWSQHCACIVVRDEGKGFDWRNLPDPLDPENMLRDHGRGLFLASVHVSSLLFNESGNEVMLIKSLAPFSSRTT